jgi:hypothetical protein
MGGDQKVQSELKNTSEAVSATLAYMDFRDTVIAACVYLYDRKTGFHFGGNKEYNAWHEAANAAQRAYKDSQSPQKHSRDSRSISRLFAHA